MANSKIEWTDRSDWNPIRGCTRVSPGCGGPGNFGGCYAEAMAGRFSDPGQWGHGYAERTSKGGRWTGKVELIEERLTLPLRWRKPAKVFASSTSDIFHEALSEESIADIFGVMAVAATKFQGPHDGFDVRGHFDTSDGRKVPLRWPRLRSGPHTFQALTKRSSKMRALMSSARFRKLVAHAAYRHAHDRVDAGDRYDRIMDGQLWPLPNVWLGVSVEDQQRADERREDLRNTPAAIRFVSYEPALGPVDWTGWEFVDQIIGGGESGPNARPAHPDWFRATRDFCAANGIAYFFKQWGAWAPRGECDRKAEMVMARDSLWLSQGAHFDIPDCDYGTLMWNVGKKAAGRLLDGVRHDGMPA